MQGSLTQYMIFTRYNRPIYIHEHASDGINELLHTAGLCVVSIFMGRPDFIII